MQTTTTTQLLKEPWPSRVTLRVSTTTHGLLHNMAVADGFRSAAELVRHYMAKGLIADGIDPTDLGLLPPNT